MNNNYVRTLELYRKIDSTIDSHFQSKRKQAPCSKGCSSCCSQFFEISDLEFAVIYEALDQLSIVKKEALKIRANTLMDLFKTNWSAFYHAYFTKENILKTSDDYYTHPDRFSVHLPCVFLSDEGSCEIYASRPTTCRTTGVAYQHLINSGAVCNYIRLGIFTPLWQANLRPLKEEIEHTKWLLSDLDDTYLRQFPMFYYVYDLLVNENNQKYLFQLQTFKQSLK